VRSKGEEHAGVRGGKHQGAAAAGGKSYRQVRSDHPGNRGQKWRGKCLLGTAELLLLAHVTKTRKPFWRRSTQLIS